MCIRSVYTRCLHSHSSDWVLTLLNVQRPSETSSSLTLSTKHAAHAEWNIHYATVQLHKTESLMKFTRSAQVKPSKQHHQSNTHTPHHLHHTHSVMGQLTLQISWTTSAWTDNDTRITWWYCIGSLQWCLTLNDRVSWNQNTLLAMSIHWLRQAVKKTHYTQVHSHS